MINKIDMHHILFLDIETVPQYASFEELDEADQELYSDKTKYQRKEDFTPHEFYERAGIWAEFGKIVCISVGYFAYTSDTQFRTKSFVGDERDILIEFSQLLKEHFSSRQHLLCAHNGKEFDFPYIARRMIILGMDLPEKLNLFGKKPWEVPHLDTMELWKFGDYKHFTSLKLLTRVLGIPSPKDDISGDQVRDVYYKENDIKRISDYCEKDVVAIAQIFLKLRNQPILSNDQIISK
ncbi:3'-5' exonuclease [Nonlabens sp. SCSIO 43208]|uniref:3'-5' exonuclease n=1 Tax=Nonlabens sp. SCSIO 43208 TaxID=2793009 RepID=UPI003D6AD44B